MTKDIKYKMMGYLEQQLSLFYYQIEYDGIVQDYFPSGYNEINDIKIFYYEGFLKKYTLSAKYLNYLRDIQYPK